MMNTVCTPCECRCSKWPEEGDWSLRAGVTRGYELSCECWDLNSTWAVNALTPSHLPVTSPAWWCQVVTCCTLPPVIGLSSVRLCLYFKPTSSAQGDIAIRIACSAKSSWQLWSRTQAATCQQSLPAWGKSVMSLKWVFQSFCWISDVI